MRQAFDAGCEFDERPELGDAGDAARMHLSDGIAARHRRPRIALQLLQPKRNLPAGLVHAQDLHRDLVTDGDHCGGARDSRPAHFRDVEQSLDAAAEVDERAEVEHRGHAASEDRVGHDRFPDRLGVGLLLAFEQFSPRQDDVLAAVLVFDDLEGEHLADVNGWIGGAGDVDLRQRAERAFARDAHFVAALDGLGTLPSTATPFRNASSSSRSVAALRTPLRDSVMPPLVETTIAVILSPTDTSMSPSASFSSATSSSASPLPPMSTNANCGPIATMVPSTAWPRLNCRAFSDASNNAAKSSSCSLTNDSLAGVTSP